MPAKIQNPAAPTAAAPVAPDYAAAIRAIAATDRAAGREHVPQRFVPDMTRVSTLSESIYTAAPNGPSRKNISEAEKATRAAAAAADSILKALEAGVSVTDVLAEALREAKARATTQSSARLFAPAISRAAQIVK